MFDAVTFLSGPATADSSPGGDLCKAVNGVELPADGLRCPVASANERNGPEVGPDRFSACDVADACESLHPGRAAELRGMADALDGDERKTADGT